MGKLRDLLRRIFPDDPEPGCGYGPLKTGPDDPFLEECIEHDEAWGKQEGDPAEHNEKFLRKMLAKAKARGGVLLTARAWLYYGLAAGFGYLLW